MTISREDALLILRRFTDDRNPVLAVAFSVASGIAMFAGLAKLSESMERLMIQQPDHYPFGLSLTVLLSSVSTFEFGDLHQVTDHLPLPDEYKALFRRASDGAIVCTFPNEEILAVVGIDAERIEQ